MISDLLKSLSLIALVIGLAASIANKFYLERQISQSLLRSEGLQKVIPISEADASVPLFALFSNASSIPVRIVTKGREYVVTVNVNGYCFYSCTWQVDADSALRLSVGEAFRKDK